MTGPTGGEHVGMPHDPVQHLLRPGSSGELPDKSAIDGGTTGNGRWQVAWATRVGSAHVAKAQVREDAAMVHVGDGMVVAAVSDGHGMARSFRAHEGSELAVEAAIDVALAGVDQWRSTQQGASEGAVWLREDFTDAVLARWRQLVLDDVADKPLTDAERELTQTTDDVYVAYGATLLVVMADDQRLLAWQLGDGDLVLAPGSGTAGPAVAVDPHLLGNRTTSLCQPEASEYVRTAVHEVGPERTILIAATDGFANAMAEPDWQERLGADLHGFFEGEGFSAVARTLPQWVAEAAQASGDDVSVVVLVAAGVAAVDPAVDPAVVPVAVSAGAPVSAPLGQTLAADRRAGDPRRADSRDSGDTGDSPSARGVTGRLVRLRGMRAAVGVLVVLLVVLGFVVWWSTTRADGSRPPATPTETTQTGAGTSDEPSRPRATPPSVRPRGTAAPTVIPTEVTITPKD